MALPTNHQNNVNEKIMAEHINDIAAEVNRDVQALTAHGADELAHPAIRVRLDNIEQRLEALESTNVLAQPTGLTVHPEDGRAIIDWADNIEGDLQDYLVQQSTDNATWAAAAGSPVIASTLTVTGLTNGTTYYFRVAARDTSLNVSSYTASVAGTPGTTTVSSSSSSVDRGAEITARWTAPAGSSATDWVGIYAVGAANTDDSHDWAYTNGLTTGTMSLLMPIQPGNYELRYGVNGTYTVTATSAVITVTNTGLLLFDGRTIGAYTAFDKSFAGSTPSVNGSNVTSVTDPGGLSRNVIRIDLHEDDKETTNNTVRLQGRKDIVHPNDTEQWIYHEHRLPTGFPNVATDAEVTSPFFLLNEPHFPPFTGSPPFALYIKVIDGVQKLAVIHNGNYTPAPWTVMWEAPRTLDVWHKIAFRVRWSTDAAVGWLEIYYAQKPNALVLQTFPDGTTRRTMQTTPPDFTSDGHFYFNHYRRAAMPDFVGKLATSYYAESRLWDGAATLAQVDPDA